MKHAKIIPVIGICAYIFSGCAGTAFMSANPASQSVPDPLASSVQYLTFQSFIGATYSQPVGSTAPAPTDQTQFKSSLESYISYVQNLIQASALSQAPNRKYGFYVGPLTMEQTDDDISASIKTAFDVAIERGVPVGFHFDVSHYWRFAQNADGTLLSAGIGATDSREWSDFTGTIAPPDPWDDPSGTLMPILCFECPQVKALVDRLAGPVIAQAISAGLQLLKTNGTPDLFAGVIVGWEAGSQNPLGYHSLSILGYTSATSLTALHTAQQGILHNYLQRWTSALVQGGVPKEKIYTHTTNQSQWDINDFDSGIQTKLGSVTAFDNWLLQYQDNGPDSFYESFNDYSNAGFSVYANSAQEGIFALIWAEAAKHNGTWGECEGTNATIQGEPSQLSWETYLGSIFNHGGSLANIFAVDVGPAGGGYAVSSESAEAVAAYQKFLSGGILASVH